VDSVGNFRKIAGYHSRKLSCPPSANSLLQSFPSNTIGVVMAPNTTFSRPWLRTFVPAGAFLVFLMLIFVSQYHEDIALPHLHGITASSKEHTTSAKAKAIVTSVQKEDETTADWLAEFLPDWQAVVYVTDRTSDEPAASNTSLISPHHLPVNKGREASVYLTYIIQHYHLLPDYVVFIHGKRYQIHSGKPASPNDHSVRRQDQLLTKIAQMIP
jgi:hypothetical protein